MLSQKELIKALLTNLCTWNWDVYSKFPIDQDTGEALVKGVQEFEANVMPAICDEYCKYPGICKTQDALDDICSRCPLDNMRGK